MAQDNQPPPEPASNRPGRGAPRVFALACLALLGGGILGFWAWDWTRLRPLPSSGGLPALWRIQLDVRILRQADPRWGNDPLGPTEGPLAAEGCAVASAAMVLRYYGIDTDPGSLNQFLQGCEGYTPQGWIYWEKAAEIAPRRIRFVYEGDPSHALIDWNLLRGNPVIVRLRYPNRVTHFVVICGKKGFDYLIADPGRGSARGVYPLKDFGSPIEALRFYEATGTPGSAR